MFKIHQALVGLCKSSLKNVTSTKATKQTIRKARKAVREIYDSCYWKTKYSQGNPSRTWKEYKNKVTDVITQPGQPEDPGYADYKNKALACIKQQEQN
jgi:hypothetical protein